MKHAGEKAAPRWTVEEDDKLLEICGMRRIIGRAEWETIVPSFPGRTLLGLRQRYLTLRNRKNGITEKDIRTRCRARVAAARQATMQAPIVPRAMPQHATLTAALCGDPLPGRSALDRRPQQ